MDRLGHHPVAAGVGVYGVGFQVAVAEYLRDQVFDKDQVHVLGDPGIGLMRGQEQAAVRHAQQHHRYRPLPRQLRHAAQIVFHLREASAAQHVIAAMAQYQEPGPVLFQHGRQAAEALPRHLARDPGVNHPARA